MDSTQAEKERTTRIRGLPSFLNHFGGPPYKWGWTHSPGAPKTFETTAVEAFGDYAGEEAFNICWQSGK